MSGERLAADDGLCDERRIADGSREPPTAHDDGLGDAADADGEFTPESSAAGLQGCGAELWAHSSVETAVVHWGHVSGSGRKTNRRPALTMTTQLS